MKPFSLSEAKAGKPLVTGQGIPHKFVAFCDEAKESNKVVTLDLKKSTLCVWSPNGTSPFTDCDLFLADPPKVKKSGWVAVMPTGKTHMQAPYITNCSHVYASKEDADKWSPKLAAVIEIHWEEEAA